MQQLQSNATLQGGKYKILEVLGQGGFGITYLAENTVLEAKVAIKEFFMKGLCEREEAAKDVTVPTRENRATVERFKQKFIKEAKTIFKLNHPNIIRIHDVFEENGTAYYVMEYAERGSLSDKVKHEGFLTEPVATRYILQVADALNYVHQRKINHLDVKPSNIMLNENGEAILIDFGLAKQYDSTGSQTSSTPVGISEGYAPMEQYKQGGVGAFSPETDIYALGATFFKLLTGMTPPSASDVNEDGMPVDVLKAKGVNQKVITTICKAMEGKKRDRMKSIPEFVDCLNGEDDTAEIVAVAEVKDDESTIVAVDTEETIQTPPANKPSAPAEPKPSPATDNKPSLNVQSNNRPSQKKPHPKNFRWSKRKTTRALIVCMAIIGICIVGTVLWDTYGHHRIPVMPADTIYAEANIDSTAIPMKEESDSIISFEVGDVTFNMIKVEAGTFIMGADSIQDPDAHNDEQPVHEVTLTEDYYIGETEVTQAMWNAVMDRTLTQIVQEDSLQLRGVGDNYPMYYVSWDDCQEFVRRLNNQFTEYNFRLPTEAEWEYAARGGKKSKGYKYSGSDNLDDVAWYDSNACDGVGSDSPDYGTHAVKTKSVNELGLYDMSGNVYEWCQDWYGHYNSGSQTNPTGPSSSSYRVRRGGSWNFYAWRCRAAYRGIDTPSFRDYNLGFRLACSSSKNE